MSSSSSASSSQGLMAAYNNGYYPLNDHHNSLSVFNADMLLSTSIMHDWSCDGGGGGGGYDGGGGEMVNTPPMMMSPYNHHYSEDISTGYLEDALLEFTNSRPKRRRLQLVYNDEPTSSSYYNHPDNMGNWSNSNCMSLGEFTGDLNSMMLMMMMDHDNFNDRRGSDQLMSNSLLDECNMIMSSYEMKASLNANSGLAMEEDQPLSSSCSDKSIPSPSLVPTSLGIKKARNEVGMKRGNSNKRIVYPFALVKPGGMEGDITINDINERILMPPVRPVRHPVGDFACRPCVSSDGRGLSGKAVVALTKIQTQGRGTITIIRTRG